MELLRTYMKQNLAKQNSGKNNHLQMFFDIHSHSSATSIFTYAPQLKDERSGVAKKFSKILDDISDYFALNKCSYNNEKFK